MKQKQTYPLYFLFVLVTICAVLMGMLVTVIPSLLSSSWGGVSIATSIVLTGLFTAVLGILIGLHHVNRSMGVMYGGSLGFVLGAGVSPLFFVDEQHFGQLLATQIGGAILLLCVAACLSLGRRRDGP